MRTAIRATVAVTGLKTKVIATQIREVATPALISALASALPFNVCESIGEIAAVTTALNHRSGVHGNCRALRFVS